MKEFTIFAFFNIFYYLHMYGRKDAFSFFG